VSSTVASLIRAHSYFSYPDLNTFLRENWESGFLNSWDANDLLTLLATWQNGDVSKIRDGGDLKKCLGAIKAKGLIMPSKTDLYFPVRIVYSLRVRLSFLGKA